MKVFFGRQGGVSKGAFASLNTSYSVGDDVFAVEENRCIVAARFNLPPERLFAPKQVHGDRIIRVDQNSAARAIADQEADAIWTTSPNIIVAVQTADCVPVLVAHRKNLAVMAIHLGWRGAAIGLAAKSIRHLCEQLAATPADFVASIGPCIGYDAYEVGQEVVEALVTTVSSMEGCARQISADKWLVDTGSVVERQLYEAGLSDVHNMKICTMKSELDYFSHRRDKGVTGRQMSAIST